MAYQNPIPILPDNPPEPKRKPAKRKIATDYQMKEEVYFAFIDVLGFKQTFDENREDPKKRFAQNYEAVFKYFGQLLCDAPFTQSGLSKAGQTSDSLYFYTDRIDFLAQFIKVYWHFSLYSMSQNVFFRGGIAKGCLFINQPHQFYGDCVIKAYLLEEKIAKFPRISIDLDTYKALGDVLDTKSCVCEDKSAGRFYLNPFMPVEDSELAIITGLDPSQIQPISKRKIVRNINEGKARFEFDERNFPKYHYLSREIKAHGKFLK